ncbi:MAG: hypothetical protein GEU80_17100 [Dehalococcoidia bacterium]|nr:hypothetical protein [Dehalococcoidia bacterium]
MTRGGRSRADGVLVAALAAGRTMHVAAVEAGVGERTVRRRIADPEFHAALLDARAQMLDAALGRLSDAATRAVETLVDSLDAESESVRVTAATALLDRLLRVREAASIETRLAALERLMDGAG